jgi:hypothetical protein
MGTLNAIYIRATRQQVAALRKEYPAARTERGLAFYVIEQPRTAFNPPEDELAALSARFDTDVLWITFQSAADAFAFHHWQSGKHLRSLVYAYAEWGVWERVEGEPEPWEREAFFDLRRLADALEGAGRKEAAQLRRIWREGELAVGRSAPMIAAWDAAHSVAEHYRLPGWSEAGH